MRPPQTRLKDPFPAPAPLWLHVYPSNGNARPTPLTPYAHPRFPTLPDTPLRQICTPCIRCGAAGGRNPQLFRHPLGRQGLAQWPPVCWQTGTFAFLTRPFINARSDTHTSCLRFRPSLAHQRAMRYSEGGTNRTRQTIGALHNIGSGKPYRVCIQRLPRLTTCKTNPSQ